MKSEVLYDAAEATWLDALDAARKLDFERATLLLESSIVLHDEGDAAAREERPRAPFAPDPLDLAEPDTAASSDHAVPHAAGFR